MKLKYEIWLPQLKFTLQTIALYYPKNPNEITIRKYYNLVQNLPVFFPEEPIGNTMRKILDDFPVQPYLNSKTSFMKWIHFVFNKINKKLEINTKSFYESLEEYYKNYKPREILNKEQIRQKKKYMYIFSVVLFLTVSTYYYNK
tara:strand:+ start:1602 stop:2033 length:432 start_codon:yes stop_codon:yes gene_type:complete